jgi:hypothetical protein
LVGDCASGRIEDRQVRIEVIYQQGAPRMSAFERISHEPRFLHIER